MMMLPSGVICGVTSSFKVASTNSTAVAPELVDFWNGTFWPWLIKALTWSAVMMRGLETTLPLPSASPSAEISRLRKRLDEAPKIDSAKLAGSVGPP